MHQPGVAQAQSRRCCCPSRHPAGWAVARQEARAAGRVLRRALGGMVAVLGRRRFRDCLSATQHTVGATAHRCAGRAEALGRRPCAACRWSRGSRRRLHRRRGFVSPSEAVVLALSTASWRYCGGGRHRRHLQVHMSCGAWTSCACPRRRERLGAYQDHIQRFRVLPFFRSRSRGPCDPSLAPSVRPIPRTRPANARYLHTTPRTTCCRKGRNNAHEEPLKHNRAGRIKIEKPHTVQCRREAMLCGERAP
jgi:hypothetical protein